MGSRSSPQLVLSQAASEDWENLSSGRGVMSDPEVTPLEEPPSPTVSDRSLESAR